jgi:signal transduction histidine kinase
MKKSTLDSSRTEYRYGLALLVSALAFIFTRWTMPIFQHNAFDFYLAAVVISACYGGFGPALLTAILAIPTFGYFFMPPFNTFSVSATDLLRLTIFTIVATLTSSLSGRLKEAKSTLQRARDELEMRVAERTQELTHVNAALEAEIVQRLTAEKEILQISHREQRRLGEDLHDGLCQTLVGLRYITQDLRETVMADGLSWADEVAQIDLRLGEALNQADLVARGLYPVELETNGLLAALRELADKISVIYRVRCRLRSAGEDFSLDLPVANHLYRIAQEALVNAIKHGKSKRVSLHLRRHRGQLILSITDDGIGLQSTGPQRRGMGLKMMMYRSRIINADFYIRSRPRGVTRVTCQLPTEKESDCGTEIQAAS